MAVSASSAIHLDLLAPLSGLIVPLESVPDPVFSQKIAGDGLSIDPTSPDLLAPMAGTVTQLPASHHAIALATPDGLEVLIHIGLDTVALKGEGFKAWVEVGDQVVAGQKLISFDPVLVGRKARSLLTQIIIVQGDRVESMHSGAGLVEAGRDLALRLTLLPASEPQPPEGGGPRGASHEAWLESPEVRLPNPCGLHARPAAVLAAAAKAFTSTIHIVKAGHAANAKSVVALLGLGTRQGDPLTLRAQGPDAAQALAALSQRLAAGCGEPVTGGDPPPPERPHPRSSPGELTGLPSAPGFAVGHIHHLRRELAEVPEQGLGGAVEREHLETALQDSALEIKAIQAQLPPEEGEARAGILSAHLELLTDPELTGPAFKALDENHSAAYAWHAAFERQAALLSNLDSELLRERASDIRDVGRRVLSHLVGGKQLNLEVPPDSILIASDLTPSETAQLDRTHVLGLCTTTGGPTGHVAIMAGALGIPAICGMDEAVLEVPEQTLVVLDGTRGSLRLEPSERDLIEAMERITLQAERHSQERTASRKRAMTADGYPLEVAANIQTAHDAREAIAAGAEGVGLLRSEFLFQDRALPPTEEEQAAEYCAVAQILGPDRRLVIRTLDVGGDKPLPYLPLPREENPFLGLRGIRVSLEHPALLRTQLRALLRCAPLCDLHIMFPMVATLEEFQAAKGLLEEELGPLAPRVKVGLMIEVPSAVLIADTLAREADFFSIGTNDLTQYCLAMDRGHPRLAKAADPLHPAVLRLISLTVEAAHQHGKWVGVCGSLASDSLALPALLGLGVDELSVSIPTIGSIKARLSHLRKDTCEALARELLSLGTGTAVRQRLASFAE